MRTRRDSREQGGDRREPPEGRAGRNDPRAGAYEREVVGEVSDFFEIANGPDGI